MPDAYRKELPWLTDTPSGDAGDLRTANTRLRSLINIGLDVASERDSDRRLQTVCASANTLCGATYATLGIVDRRDRTVQRIVTSGTDGAPWIKVGDTVPGALKAVVATGRPSRGVNPGGDPAMLELPLFHPEVHAYLAVPIASPAHVHGWICLVGNSGTPFTEEDEYVVFALAGQVGRIYELEHEIAERRQAESALRMERDRAQRYLDTAQVILLALDLEGTITAVNRKGCDLLGWTEADLIGRDWIATCVPQRMRRARMKDLDFANANLPLINEALIVTRIGEERVIEWRNTTLHDDAGRATGTFRSGIDVTDRNQALGALRTTEERMRFALQAADVGIWDMEVASGVLRWSEVLEAQYGLGPGTFGGTLEAFAASIHPDDRSSTIETITKAMRGGSDFSVLSRSVLPDGTVRWLNGAGRFELDDDGQPMRGVGVSLDVTERHSLEVQSQQTQKMEAVGRLAGGVAHDFNNLLTAILGYCELLMSDLDPADPHQSDIAQIQRAGKSAADLTRQLLAFSRKQIIQPSLLDLNHVVSSMEAMVRRLIREDVEVILSLQANGFVNADRGQVEQIVLNLALNARDAISGRGRLAIETSNVELDEQDARTQPGLPPGPYVALTVTDTGVGMSPEVQARMFEPFYTTKEMGQGTGLGLATVHGIVMGSGGSINIRSEVGKGTAFRVLLPRTGTTETTAEAPLPVVRPRAGMETVLVVEDMDGLRHLTQRLLERQGYTVLVAANADEAIRVFMENVYVDVLLTDVVMPGDSGPELTQWLVRRKPGLRVVYMSGYTEEAIVQHGVLNPGIAFLNKPFTSETLGQKIREVLDR